MPLAPLSSCLFTTYRAQSPPKQSAWPSLTKSDDTLPPALTHWPVGSEKHTSNGQILAQTLRLSPPVQLPVHHRSTHLPCSIAVKQVRMALSYLFERYLTFGTTSPACGYRKNTSNGQILAQTKRSCSPPFHPPIVLNRRETSSHASLLLSRTISYLRHYLTGLWMPKKHIQRTNACTDQTPLIPSPAPCSPPFHPPTVVRSNCRHKTQAKEVTIIRRQRSRQL